MSQLQGCCWADSCTALALFSIPVQTIAWICCYRQGSLRTRVTGRQWGLISLVSALFVCSAADHIFRFQQAAATAEQQLSQKQVCVSWILAVLSLTTALYLFHLTPDLLQHLEDNLEGVEMLDLKLKETEARLFTFMSFLCHEIRNSLFAIASTVTFMGDQEEDNGTVDPADKKEENKKSLASIQQQTDLMIRFANDVLDLSKLESGCLALHCCDFDLHEVVDNMAHIFQQQLKLKNSSIDFQFHKAPSLPAAVNGDSVRILQVVCHLLSNAVKFTESGEIVFAVSSMSTQEAVEMGCIDDFASELPRTPRDSQPTQDDDDKHDRRPQGGSNETATTASKASPLSCKVHGLSSESLDGKVHRPKLSYRETIILKLEISDTGMGMSPERLHQVWAVPYYAEEKLKHYRPQGGAGLGLALLRRLTAFMQGNLLVRSEQGRGSTFTAYLPVQVVDQNLAMSNIKASSPGLRCQTGSISLKHQSPSHACSASSSSIPPVLTPMFSAPVSPCPKRMCLSEAMDPLENTAPPTPTPTSFQLLEGSLFEVRTTSVPQRASEPWTKQTSSLSSKMAPLPLPLPSDEFLMPAQQQRTPSQEPTSLSPSLPNQPASLPKFDLPHNHAVVLVVEDNELNCRLLCKMLDFFHVEHIVAMNGQEAVDTIVSRSRNVLERSPEEEALWGSTDNDDGDAGHLPYFGMILMDQQMPIMDGSTAIALLRGKGLSIPIVALTANALYQTEALRAGATEFATKPILRQDLHAMCCRYLF